MIYHHAKRSRGFGLIEVLITLLVFSVGVLAVAGLQAISKKNNFDALQRTSAAALADSIIASMRANPGVLNQYLVSDLGGGNAPTPPKDCYSANCNPGELAAFDLAQWELLLDGATEIAPGETGNRAALQTGGLVAPSACIRRQDGTANGGSGVYEVIIVWRGVSPATNDRTDNCGDGRSLYGTVDTPATNDYKRFFILQTFI